MKIRYVFVISLFVFIFASCTTINSYVNLTKDDNPSFYIFIDEDYLNLAVIIQEEISKRGYKVIITFNKNIEKNDRSKNVLVYLNYIYHHNLVHYSLRTLRIEFIDALSGDMIGNGFYQGDDPRGADVITRTVINEMLDKIK